MQRYGSVIKVKHERLEEYKRLHCNAWQDVLDMIKKCNIQNYSIYYSTIVSRIFKVIQSIYPNNDIIF